MTTEQYQLPDLLRVMQRLRDPDSGCPWDLRQNFESLTSSTLEECYELAQAIESADYPHVEEELGDVLFQVVFYAQLGCERELFSFDDVINTLVSKLLRRHPHVFKDGDIEGVIESDTSIDHVQHSWEAIKAGERKAKSQGGVLDDVPLALPALPRAQKIQKRASGSHFDWPDHIGALAKIEEELLELKSAIAAGSQRAIEEEMGDLLFSCVNVSRHLKVDAEASLRRATKKFESRFQQVLKSAELSGHTLDQLSESELNSLWLRAKLSAGDPL